MNIDMVVYLAEQLVEELPKLFNNKYSKSLLLKAIDVLNELLIVCKNKEIISIGRLDQVIEMKKEKQEEEDINAAEFYQASHPKNDVPEMSNCSVIIRIKKLNPIEEEKEGSVTKQFVQQSSSKEPLLYHCAFCEMNFSNPDDLFSHDKQLHFTDISEYKCPECEVTNSEKETILQHYAKEHSKSKQERQLLYCPTCGQLFFNRKKLRKHHLDAHNKWLNNQTCLLCLKVFKKYKEAKYHEQVEHLNSKLCCRFKVLFKCSEIFTSYEALQQHYMVAHPINESYTCHICGVVFTKQYRAHYFRHVQTHSMTEKTVECQECDEKFFFEIDLKKHMKKHLKIYMCDICDFRTGSRCYLAKHMRIHGDERPFVCNICGKGFKLAEGYSKHMAIHSEVKKHKCDFCGKDFRHKKNLNEHRKIHTGEFGGYCDICQKGFTQKYNLTLHNLKHHQ